MKSLSHAQVIRFCDNIIFAPESFGGCWAWSGSLDVDGYGIFNARGYRTTRAHRFAYEMCVEPIPSGYVIDHICTFRACVNPEHLEAVDPIENTRRGLSPCAMNGRKTHCKFGHAFDGGNTYVRPDGGRGCKRCRLAAVLRYERRRRLEQYKGI